MEEIDTMFINILGEMDVLTQSLESATSDTSQPEQDSETDHFSFGFSNLRESLNEMEEHDLDNLVAALTTDQTTDQGLDPTPDLTINPAPDLTQDVTSDPGPDPTLDLTIDLATDLTPDLTINRTPDPTPDLTTDQGLDPIPDQTRPDLTSDLTGTHEHIPQQNHVTDQQNLPTTTTSTTTNTSTTTTTSNNTSTTTTTSNNTTTSTSTSTFWVSLDVEICHGPPPSPSAQSKVQSKADKVRLALEKLKEAKIRKRIVKVLMCDGSFKMLMVDERQRVGALLATLFEKTHCDRAVDWSLCESNAELQIERIFEDHECLVEWLCLLGRSNRNTISFVSRPQKYSPFKDPQVFYMWKNDKEALSNAKEKHKMLLLKENFEGSSVIVPDLEGVLYQKESGKRKWNPRYFLLRASGIYYIPKGKTKSSIHLSCLVRFENVNVYTASGYRQKYRAPSNFCFILKHPCLQKESEYINFLCCEDEHTLSLWVNSIRVAKYGATLYKNYLAAVHRSVTQTSTLHLNRSPDGQTASRVLRGREEGQTVKQQSSSPQPQPGVVCGAPDTPVDCLDEPPPDFTPRAPPGYTPS